jgi:hypothetical protein
VKIISEDDLLQLIETRPGDDVTPKKHPAPKSQPLPPPSPVKSKPTSYTDVGDVDKAKTSLSTPPTPIDNSPSTPKLSADESTMMCTYSSE